MNAVHLTLEQAPCTFNRVRVSIEADVLASAVIDRNHAVRNAELAVSRRIVGHERGLGVNVVEYAAPYCASLQVWNLARTDAAIALDQTEHGGLLLLAALVLGPVAVFAAEIGLIHLDGAG